jgi:methylase of polypeptide subunit release factors
MPAGQRVNLIEDQIPDDYHCDCEYCRKAIGELRPTNDTYYSRNERREYYAKEETRKKDGSGHIAKTPLHIARWAIQQYTRPGDWVLDPTIGAGTTAVEALTQGRNAAGMELEYGSILKANVEKALLSPGARDCVAAVASGDARNIAQFLQGLDLPRTKRKFQLIVNNPPYSGDISAYPLRDKDGNPTENKSYLYDKNLPNLAHLKENDEYWQTIDDIYDACIARLVPGGHFVIGVKDQVRGGKSDRLHRGYCESILGDDDMEFVGTAFLRHYPGTLNTSRGLKEGNREVAQYQTISVFRKRPIIRIGGPNANVTMNR